jgi:hypothetical protein
MELNELLGWEDLRHGTNQTIEAILISIALIRLTEVVIC